MADRRPEGVDRLTRQRPAAQIGDGDRDHERQPFVVRRSTFVVDLFDGDDRGLRVQRVENSLEQEHVAPAIDQAADLILVGVFQRVERDRPKGRVVHLRRD